MSNFNQCNSVADRWEKEVFIVLLNQDKLVSGYKWNGGRHPEYDEKLLLSPDGKEITIEVKAQSIYNTVDPTDDHFVIETQQGGQPSGLSLTESDYYYIFKYDKSDQELMTKIYYNKTVDGKEETGIKYTLHRIKTDVIRDIIASNPNLPTSTFNDCRKGGNNVSYKINMSYFNDLPISDYSAVEDVLDNEQLIDLNKNKLILPELRDRTYYVEESGKKHVFLDEDDDMIIPDIDDVGEEYNKLVKNTGGLELLNFISKK
jgi:hypothetical protein